MHLKNMIILDIIDKYPETLTVFKEYENKTSTCICCTSLFETLETAASIHEIKLESIIKDLKTIIIIGTVNKKL